MAKKIKSKRKNVTKRLLPKSIVIFGKQWKIEHVDIESEFGNVNAYGMTVFDPLSNTRTIYIDASVTTAYAIKRVLLHELFHAIVCECKLPAGSLNETAEEVLAESIAEFFVTWKK